MFPAQSLAFEDPNWTCIDVIIAANVWIDDLFIQDATNGFITVERQTRFLTAQVIL